MLIIMTESHTPTLLDVWTVTGNRRLTLIVCSTSVRQMRGKKVEKEEGRQRWREHEPRPSDPEMQQNHRHQRSDRDRERIVHMCVWPYLHYLCAGMRDEVLLVRIYDSHLD